MADELVIRNYLAGSAIKAGQVVALDSTQDVLAPSAIPASTTALGIIGLAIKDSNEGEEITFRPFITGEIRPVIAGAAITAGDVLGVNASSLLEPAGSGNVAVPLQALEAASASGDVILAAVVHPGEVGA